jgi:hypothetical protein
VSQLGSIAVTVIRANITGTRRCRSSGSKNSKTKTEMNNKKVHETAKKALLTHSIQYIVRVFPLLTAN